MPMYDIQGADARTGQDRSISFEADDDAQAAAVAKVRGVMVAKLERRAPPPTVEYAVPVARNGSTASVDPLDDTRTSQSGTSASVADVLKGARVVVGAVLLIGIVLLMVQEHPVTSDGAELTAAARTIADRLFAILLAVLVVAVLLVPTSRH